MSEEREKIEKLKEEVKKIEEELKRIEESTSALKLEKVSEIVNKLSDLRIGWKNVYDCLGNKCVVVISEFHERVTVDAPTTVTINVTKSMALEKVFEIVREEIVKRLPEFSRYTSDILSDVVKMYVDVVEKPLYEMKYITRSLDEIKERLERVEEKIEEIEKEEEEEEDC
ncbi:MAG: hypothetical protein QXT64_01310 [Desulfurococcaceae archaeon]